MDTTTPTAAAHCCAPAPDAPLGAGRRVRPAVSLAVTRLKALADPTRLAIVGVLAAHAEPVCVCDLNDGIALEQPTVSHHLRILRDAALVTAERRGTWAYYRLHPETEAWVRQTLAALPEEQP